MYGMEELYEPDEILRDVDLGSDASQEEGVDELNFESEYKSSEAMELLIDEVGTPEDLY